MQRLFTSFPSGAAGLALVLLRLCVATSLVTALILSIESITLIAIVAVLVVLAVLIGLCIGMWTPMACLLAILCLVAVGWGHGNLPHLRMGLDIAQALALALLGPGAYSVDAKRYGRHEIVIPR